MSSKSSGPRAGEAPTPIPYKKVAILGLILSANNTSIWMIFSFLPFMVQFYFPDLTKAELGYHAGMLGSAFSAGSLFGNVIWGYVSDRLGRRPALLMGLLGTAACALSFGFAPSFLVAVLSRFLWGLLNGNIGVAKTYLGEISDDSNAAKGMALFGVIGGFGRTVGPVIGGFLSSPARSWPSLFAGTIFETYPFALPCLVISVNCLLVFVVSFFFLAETLPAERVRACGVWGELCACVWGCGRGQREYSLLHGAESEKSVEMSLVDDSGVSKEEDEEEEREGDEREKLFSPSLASSFGRNSNRDRERDRRRESRRGRGGGSRRLTFSNVVTVRVIDEPVQGFQVLKGIAAHERPLNESDPVSLPVFSRLHNSNEDRNSESDAESPFPQRIERYSNGAEQAAQEESERSYWSLVRHALSQREVLLSTLMYGTNALVGIVVNEVFPLWVVTSRAQGGFQFNERKIGISTMICGVLAVVLQVFLYPMLVDRHGVLAVLKLGVLLCAVGCFFTPAVSAINGLHWPALEWTLIASSQLLLAVSSTWTLISVFVLINNSCYSYQRATVNGIGQTFASLGRLCGPYVGAVLFAWSETNGLSWPFNYYFVFYLLVLISAGNYCLTNMLPLSIQRRKREPSIPTDEEVEEYLRMTLTISQSHGNITNGGRTHKRSTSLHVAEEEKEIEVEVQEQDGYFALPSDADER